MAKKVRVKMNTTAACPQYVLYAGKTYLLDESVAAPFIAGGGPDDKPAAVRVAGGKLTAITKPDPGEDAKSESEEEEETEVAEE